MRDFFRGWRRKAGVVALLMACIVFAAWMRSLEFDFGLRGTSSLIASQGSLEWSRSSEFAEPHTTEPLRWFHRKHTTMSGMQFEGKTISRLEMAGFVAYSYRIVDFGGVSMYRVDRWLVPFWGILLPTTLLSAYLILWKPGSSTPRKEPKDARIL